MMVSEQCLEAVEGTLQTRTHGPAHRTPHWAPLGHHDMPFAFLSMKWLAVEYNVMAGHQEQRDLFREKL